MSWGQLFIFHRKTPLEIDKVNFQNSPVTNVSLYHGEKQSDKWSDITVIALQFFKKSFSCVEEQRRIKERQL